MKIELCKPTTGFILETTLKSLKKTYDIESQFHVESQLLTYIKSLQEAPAVLVST